MNFEMWLNIKSKSLVLTVILARLNFRLKLTEAVINNKTEIKQPTEKHC